MPTTASRGQRMSPRNFVCAGKVTDMGRNPATVTIYDTRISAGMLVFIEGYSSDGGGNFQLKAINDGSFTISHNTSGFDFNLCYVVMRAE